MKPKRYKLPHNCDSVLIKDLNILLIKQRKTKQKTKKNKITKKSENHININMDLVYKLLKRINYNDFVLKYGLSEEEVDELINFMELYYWYHYPDDKNI